MTRITLTTGDITQVAVDAIVNAANSRLAGGGGVDGAIHRAGGPVILEECRRWVTANGLLRTGEAMATTAGDMPSRLVIHTVGPVWESHNESTARELLASCYRSCLDLAERAGCTSIAFPNISTGVYGFPKRPAAETALSAVREWVNGENGIEEVRFVCFDEENGGVYTSLMGS